MLGGNPGEAIHGTLFQGYLMVSFASTVLFYVRSTHKKSLAVPHLTTVRSISSGESFSFRGIVFHNTPSQGSFLERYNRAATDLSLLVTASHGTAVHTQQYSRSNTYSALIRVEAGYDVLWVFCYALPVALMLTVVVAID